MKRWYMIPISFVLVLAGLALYSILSSDVPEDQVVTGGDIVLSTIGWTWHFIVISSPIWIAVLVIVSVVRWRRSKNQPDNLNPW